MYTVHVTGRAVLLVQEHYFLVGSYISVTNLTKRAVFKKMPRNTAKPQRPRP